MKFSYNEYNQIRKKYLMSKTISEENKVLNIIVEDKFKIYQKYIEEENRVRNIIRILFLNEFWNEFKQLNLTPQEFYNNFLYKAKELNKEKNKYNFDNQLHFNPELKKSYENLEDKLYKVTVDTVNKLAPLYQIHYELNIK